MGDIRTQGLSIRVPMLLGFLFMLALWLFASGQLSRQAASAQERAGAANARCNAAQETLANIRSRVSIASVAFRVQSLNRASCVQPQQEIAEIYRSVQRGQREILGLASTVGVAIAVLAVVYAGRLDRQLHAQLARDVELTRGLQHLSAKVNKAVVPAKG